MLNYIWAGLIIFSLVFALNTDIRDLTQDRYRNGHAIPATFRLKEGADPAAREVNVDVHIDQDIYKSHYRTDASPPTSYVGVLTRSEAGAQVRFGRDVALPAPWSMMRDATDDKELRARVLDSDTTSTTQYVALVFDPVRFVKLRAIASAAFEFAKRAVEMALALIGILALWLGLMKIAEASGLVAILVKLMNPLLRPLFPQVPRDHPALGMIALNLAANVLGLANAATPFGLKAMEELQKLNRSDDTATDPMVMLLAMNTAGVQLVPSALLVAVVGMTVTELFVPIVIVTGAALVIAIITCKLFERLPWYRRTNPIKETA
jgi:spore maturation protein A